MSTACDATPAPTEAEADAPAPTPDPAPAAEADAAPSPAEPAAPPAPPTPTPSEPQTCADKVAAMDARMQGFCALMTDTANLDGPPAPAQLEPPWHRYPALPLVVTAETIELDGQPVELDELEYAWSYKSEYVGGSSRYTAYTNPVVRWLLSADPSLPATRVLAVLDQLERSGHLDGAIVFHGDARPPYTAPDPEYAAKLAKLVDAAPPERRSTALAEEIKATLVPKCWALEEAFYQVAMATPDERCAVLSTHASEALRSCDCVLEPDRVETLMTTIAPPPAFETIPVYLRLSMAGEWVPYAEGETWGEVVARVDWASVDDPVEPHAIWFEPAWPARTEAALAPLREACAAQPPDFEACATSCRHGDAAGCLAWARDRSGLARRGRSAELELRAVALAEARCREAREISQCTLAAQMLDRYAGYGRTENRRARAELLALACEYGDDDACMGAGYELTQLDDDAGALVHYGTACTRGHEGACTMQAELESALLPSGAADD